MSCGAPKTVVVYRDLVGWDDDGGYMSEEWNISPFTSLLDVVRLTTCCNGVQATTLSLCGRNGHIMWSQDCGFKIPKTTSLYSIMCFIRGYGGAGPSEQVGKYVFIATFPPPSFELKA